MAFSFIQWENIVQDFSDKRLVQEAEQPGSTTSGMEAAPSVIIDHEMSRRMRERKPPAGNQPQETIHDQITNKFAGEEGTERGRPVGGPGGGPPLGNMQTAQAPVANQPAIAAPTNIPQASLGGPPPGGPPPGGPPAMAHGGLVPGYEEGGFMSGLGRLFTGAGSLEEAAENPLRTLGHSALSGMMFIPGLGLVGAAGRGGLKLLGGGARLGSGLLKGKRTTKLLDPILERTGASALGMAEKGGIRGLIGRGLLGKKSTGFDPLRSAEFIGPRMPKVVQAGIPSALSRAGTLAPRSGRTLGTSGFIGTRELGKTALLRGSVPAGIAGLLAMDPFDSGKPEDKFPDPGNDIRNTNAMIEDRGYGYPSYAWMDEGLPYQGGGELERDRERFGFNDYRDDANQAMASGGIISLQNGGSTDDPEREYRYEWDKFAGPDPDVPEHSIWKGLGRGIMRELLMPGYGKLQHGIRGAENLYEGLMPGEQYGGLRRGPEGQLLARHLFADKDDPSSYYDPSVSGWSGGKRRLEDDGTGEGGPVEDGESRLPDDVFEELMGRIRPEDQVAEDVQKQISELYGREQEEFRTETPEDEELLRLRQAEIDRRLAGKKGAFLRTIGQGITHMGERPGTLADALSQAGAEQEQIAREVALLKEEQHLPAVARARYSTYEGQQGALRDIFIAASGRGDIQTQIEPQLQALHNELMEKGRLTPEELLQLDQILRIMEEEDIIDAEGRRDYFEAFTATGIGQIVADVNAGAGGRTTPARGSL